MNVAKTLLIVVALLPLTSCSTEPEPIAFGKDQCHFCKMTIVDKKFGAELVTSKGKVYKFDDVKCLLDFQEPGSDETYLHTLVIDFAGNGELIDAKNAHFVASPEIRSPMNGQAAAFSSQSALDDANKEWNGTHVSWSELSTRFE